MKISKRDIMLLIGFVGILAGICSYFFVFSPVMEKADALENENAQLQTRILDLSEKMANKESYKTQTEEMQKEMKQIYQLFPVNVKEEDSILLAINQELLSPMVIATVTIDPLEEVSFLEDAETEEVEYTYEIAEVEQLEAQEGVVDPATAETPDAVNGSTTGVSPLGLYNRKVTFNYGVSYEGLKRSIKNLNLQSNRTSIDNVTVVYDEETGLLMGTTTVNMYCVPNQEGKEYREPDFSSVLLGTDNIFGTIVIQSEANLEDLDMADGEDGEEEENDETDE